MSYTIENNQVIIKDKIYEIHRFQNIKYILIPTNKEPHGWFNQYNKKLKNGEFKTIKERECTSERLLVNWANGCDVTCKFCYTQGMCSFLVYMKLFWETGIISVWVNYVESLERVLTSKSLNVATIAYISPLIDPFMTLEKKFHLTEKIIETFLK